MLLLKTELFKMHKFPGAWKNNFTLVNHGVLSCWPDLGKKCFVFKPQIWFEIYFQKDLKISRQTVNSDPKYADVCRIVKYLQAVSKIQNMTSPL